MNKSLPNRLTAARFVMVAIFPPAYFYISPTAGLVVYVAAFLTDILDGYLARKLDAVTPWGQTMDPLADKLMLNVTLLCLAASGRVPWLLFIFVVGKDAVMVVGGLFMYHRMDKFIQPANFIGKLSTFAYLAAIVLSFFDLPQVYGVNVSLALLYTAFGLSLAAFCSYALGFARRFFAQGGTEA